MHSAHGGFGASLPPHHHDVPNIYAGSSVLEHRHYNPMTHQINHFNQHQHASESSSRTASRPASPVFQQASLPDPSLAKSRLGTSSAVASYLQLPSTIAHGKPGSLAEFAAQITCLFWFESSSTLDSVEQAESPPLPASPLAQEAFPVTGFLKWVTTILTTTQVTQNVVLLALLFVYRLKKQNPLVKGKPGSEYRLLTVALMLGNKFLDDNTYTNKTWAEVSGISVHEIHVMEVEFLSHMKYNLYTSKDEWEDWHKQLGKFWTYFDRASHKLTEIGPKSISSRPSSLQIPHPLPSPPASINASPPYMPSASPANFQYGNAPNATPYHQPTSVSPVGSASEYDMPPIGGRKRSWDENVQLEPHPKRHFSHAPYQLPSSNFAHTASSKASSNAHLPHLPMPNLPFPAGQHAYPTPSPLSTQPVLQNQESTSTARSTPGPYLPPVNWLQAVHPSTASSASTPVGSHNPLQFPGISHGPSRRQTPAFATPHYASSDAGAGTPNPVHHSTVISHTHTQSQLSPSHFLSKRTSPYKPVRNISTLLVPPPSNQMSTYPANVSYDQMHWQPLSKNTNERRTGRVPYFQREAWPLVNQFEPWPMQYAAS